MRVIRAQPPLAVRPTSVAEAWTVADFGILAGHCGTGRADGPAHPRVAAEAIDTRFSHLNAGNVRGRRVRQRN